MCCVFFLLSVDEKDVFFVPNEEFLSKKLTSKLVQQIQVSYTITYVQKSVKFLLLLNSGRLQHLFGFFFALSLERA